MNCELCKKEIPLKKGFSRVWYCKDCEVTYYMTYGVNKKVVEMTEEKPIIKECSYCGGIGCACCGGKGYLEIK